MNSVDQSMTYYTNWAVLKSIAEHSPKEYAIQIWNRNTALLKVLEEYREWQLEVGYVTDETIIEIGCPHCNECYDCQDCVWVQQGGSKCTGISFGSRTLGDVARSEGFSILYAASSATIKVQSLNLSDNVLSDSYNACKRFLEMHSKWATFDYWGQLV